MIITNENSNKLAWDKMDNLLPAIVQDALSGKVLMQGYMDQDALTRTFETGKVTFFSRSKQRLWTKGETSGNTLDLVSVACDCDQDSLLVLANPNDLPATPVQKAVGLTVIHLHLLSLQT